MGPHSPHCWSHATISIVQSEARQECQVASRAGDNIIAEAGDIASHTSVERPVVTTLLTAADTGTIPPAPGACHVHTSPGKPGERCGEITIIFTYMK